MTIQELQHKSSSLRYEVSVLRESATELWKEYDKRIASYRESQLAAYECDVLELRTKESQLTAVESLLVDALKTAKESNPPMPIGTVLCRWERSLSTGEPRLTSVRGVFSIYRRGDRTSKGNWYVPNDGDFIIRQLLPSGKPSVNVYPYNSSWEEYYWQPVGVSPQGKAPVLQT